MPRFFFDLYDDLSVSTDAHGDHFVDIGEAGEQAIGLLADMLRDCLPSRSGQTYGCNVRDETGAVVYEASLMLKVEGDAVRLAV